MATLTETAYYARKYINWAAIGIVAFIIVRILFGIFLDYLRTTFPPVVKPNNLFGRLPAIQFPQSASPSAEITFKLQTISGTVPEASSTARVFFMPKGRANLLSLSSAQSIVGELDFTTSPRQLTETGYEWIDIRNPLRSINMDIVSRQFTLTYLFQHDLTLFITGAVPTPQQASTEALDLLKNTSVQISDINVSNPNFQYLKLVGNRLSQTTSQSQADAIQIDFFRVPYDRIPIVTDKPGVGNVQFIFSGTRQNGKRILYAKNNHWPVEFSSPAIYKLKTSTEAWTEFLSGKGFIATLPASQKTEIAITNVYLAYYDSSLPQIYMQPVFVIEGEDGFKAYVPAIAQPWTE